MKTTMAGTIRKTLKEVMEKDPRVFLLGEDIGIYGGIFNATLGLQKEFGENRVIDAPLSELAIIGSGIGAAIAGMRPVIEIMYSDFLPICMDQIINNAAKMHFVSRGEVTVPLVIRANYGANGKGMGAHHSQTPEGWLMNVPGLKIVVPSNASDARGLLLSAIYDDNPVLFLEHKQIYQKTSELVELGPIPLGKADVKRSGSDITVVATGLMLQRSLDAAEKLNEFGISVEVIDLRTVRPFDSETVINSVNKTGRLITVEENPKIGGWGAHIVSEVVENCFRSLKDSPIRVAEPDIHMPALPELENQVIPSVSDIVNKVKQLFAK